MAKYADDDGRPSLDFHRVRPGRPPGRSRLVGAETAMGLTILTLEHETGLQTWHVAEPEHPIPCVEVGISTLCGYRRFRKRLVNGYRYTPIEQANDYLDGLWRVRKRLSRTYYVTWADTTRIGGAYDNETAAGETSFSEFLAEQMHFMAGVWCPPEWELADYREVLEQYNRAGLVMRARHIVGLCEL